MPVRSPRRSAPAANRVQQDLANMNKMDPSSLRVLVVDSKPSSRCEVVSLLQECSYQVTVVKSSKEAMELLESRDGGSSVESPFDIVLKEHEPPHANACRLLRKFIRGKRLVTTPVVVFSSQDDRELVAQCLQSGASDYLVKPLRHNELKNLWTRVWRRVWPAPAGLETALQADVSSQESVETKCEDEEEPTSKEGSAPGQEGGGSKEANGSNSRDKARSYTRYQSTGVVSHNSPMAKQKLKLKQMQTREGSDKQANGNGSNGNGASTTLKPELGALRGTAEGGKAVPAAFSAEDRDGPTLERPTPMRYSAVEQLVGVKRTASEMILDHPQDRGTTSDREKIPASDRTGAGSNFGTIPTSCHTSEDTYHASEVLPAECAFSHTIPSVFSPQLSAMPVYLQGGAPPGTQGPVPWPPGSGCTNQHQPAAQQADSSPEQWTRTAMLQNLFGPVGPAQAQLMVQIQLLAEKSGVPPQVLFQQVLADSSHLFGWMSQTPPAATPMQMPQPPPQMPSPMGRPMLSPFSSNIFAGPPNVPGFESRAGGWPGLGELPRPQAAQQHQSVLMTEMMRQQQQLAFLMQSLQLWGMINPSTNPQQNQGGLFPSPMFPPPDFAPPVSASEPSVAMSVGGKGDSPATLLECKEKTGLADPRKEHRRVAVDKYREKRKNLNSSNTIRYPSRRELAQQRPRSRGQFVSYKRTEEEDDGVETRTNARSKVAEDVEEDDVAAEDEGDDAQSPRREEVPEAWQVSDAKRKAPGSVPVPHTYSMLRTGMTRIVPGLLHHGSDKYQKPSSSAVGGTVVNNNCRNNSDSGSNCPDMQNHDK